MLKIDAEGRWFQMDDAEGPVHLGRRRVLHRIVKALADHRVRMPGAPVTHHMIFEAGWPNERALQSAIDNRIRVAIATLRRMGLRDVLKTGERSYWLDPRVELAWGDEPKQLAA